MNKPVQARSLLMIERVLDAAESVVTRQGIGSLTMDAVAAEASVSKGAVLHHFRSKDALVEALVSRKLQMLERDLESHTADLPEGGSRTLLGMVRQATGQYVDGQAFPRALLMAAVENPNALDQFRALFADTLQRVEAEAKGREVDPVLLFAIMGLLLTKSLGIAGLEPERAQNMFAAIAQLAARATS